MSTSPKIKLTYFDIRGRAEVARLVLAAAKIPYEDIRIGFDQWPALKSSTPLGSVPVLEVDGQKFTQSVAIAAYLAKENGLYGSSALEQLAIDQVALAREDLTQAVGKFMSEKDEKKKAELEKTLKEEQEPKFLGFFNKLIKENPTKSGFVVGSKITLADLVVFETTQMLSEKEPQTLDKYPEIKALRTKVTGSDGIKQYLATRKPTPF
ncbi:probable glutathione S-transferase 7 [Aplysia californica]|uniref:Probable glutathione S-transferase 7 n=1 Tax=Aplysia californica TaxID=6500 RepID=A0ABM1VP23_APLCA|nr:probable glutathione S-transferase 7 [Aplysia californica]